MESLAWTLLWKKARIIFLAFALVVSAFAGFAVSPRSETAYAQTDPQVFKDRFLQLYNQIKNPANGYFSPEGIPYHSIETLISEAPDYGHMTTSEAFSYWLWLETLYGYFTGDWSKLEQAWTKMEQFIIPNSTEQPTMGSYNPSSPATYAPEHPYPDRYPTLLNNSVPAGQDPLDAELKATYGNNVTYLMHWLLDVDNWYGFGNLLNPSHTATYVNTFQRGEQESVWEAITHPSQDNFRFGKPNEGFVTLFVKDNGTPAQQWRYTAASDADARAIQVMYWAKQLGYNNQTYLDKARKMGDYLRYTLFDKYFQQIGSANDGSPSPGSGKNSAHYLLSWYTAWGGGLGSGGNWAWRIGSSHAHQGYQNPVAAYALSAGGLAPRSATAQTDWATSLQRQLEFYTWLQSSEGAIGGGATNSVGGSYQPYPSGRSTFYGMVYDEAPVYRDPPSNSWFGFQAWSVERVAELYYIWTSSGNTNTQQFQMVKNIVTKWVDWALDYTFVNQRPVTDAQGYFLTSSGSRVLGGNNPQIATVSDPGQFYIPSTLEWQGQPDTWNGYANYTGNPNFHAIAKDPGQDVGVTGNYIKLLTFFAAATKAETGNYTALGSQALNVAEQLLNVLWNFNDGVGIVRPEQRADYFRYFTKEIYFPSGWSGTYGQGNTIPGPGAVPSDPSKGGNGVYISYAELRPKIKQDPKWSYLENLYKTSYNPSTGRWENGVPTFTYHRFWAQVDVATAYAEFARLIGGLGASPTPTPSATPTPTPSAGGNLVVQYRAADTNATDNQLKPHFRIVNRGTTSVPLSELTIRYWYTVDGDKPQVFNCDWAQVGCSNVRGSFVKLTTGRTGADYYIEITFTSGAGSLAAGGSSGDIQVRINKNDWTNYNEANDYSCDPTKTSFADWNRVTLYRNGQLVWGVEP
ncbi:MAG: cellulose 1,4-beta-cellobiosidase [Candidatus Reconcilbacillus cellulovorans]|uniref:Cellulose 1,4-beta-cellobiosidase n=1 Tax=Candidatus Reconcilbacillus cellulovorans TaxID=1906605 RepID=A0A2A6DZ61_9BACL|nr:MAG: cellulose 1,4-beta-cellobiosidase [Candidatus Reconcilbacillus cellulovorans]